MQQELVELVKGVGLVNNLLPSYFKIIIEQQRDSCGDIFMRLLEENVRRDLPLTLSKTKTQYNELAGKASLQAITEMLK